MALEDNRVITNPDLIAANNKDYVVGQVKPKVPNLFAGLTNQQQRNMTYSADELDRGYKSVVPVQQVQPSVDPLSGHESVGHGSEVSVPKQEPSVADVKAAVAAQRAAGKKVWGDQGTGMLGTYSQPRPQITSMDELAAAMGYTSPEEEARLRKASVNNQRILAVADALRHIGNIANTANYAPSQQFNRPWAEEQARYEQGKAMRDKANSALLTYQQQRARQEALQKQWEAEQKFKRDKAAADAEALKEYREGQLKAKEAETARKKANDDRNYDLRKGTDAWRKEQGQQRINIAASKKGGSSGGSRVRRVGGGKGGGYEFYDKNGVRHTAKTVTELDAKLQEYAPEIASSEEYVKGVDALNRPVKGNRRISAGRRAGNANRKYRPGSKGRGSNNSGFFNS